MSLRALVVGGTNGIGYAMASRIAAQSASSAVSIVGRTKPENLRPNMQFHRLDATSMRNIKDFTDTIKSQDAPKLDLLIMSQGIMSMAGRTETSEGIDRKLALHYYGKMLLVRELMPILKDDAKVVIVYDGWSGNAKKLIWDDLDLKHKYSLGNAANNAIVMNDAMIQHFAAEQAKSATSAKRHFIHAYPGGVNTSLTRQLPWYIRLAAKPLALITVTPDVCAEYLLEGTTKVSIEREQAGLYWSNIDNKGKVISNKTVFTDKERDTIATHTWTLIDGAIAKEQTA